MTEIIGGVELPNAGTFGGFDTVPASATTPSASTRRLDAVARPTRPKWSLHDSARAPWTRLEAPDDSVRGKDRFVIQDPTPGDPEAVARLAQESEQELAPKETRDLFTWEQCEEHDPVTPLTSKVVLRNHYALCVVARARYWFRGCVDGACTPDGYYDYRLTLLGEGTRGGQILTLRGRVDRWRAFGAVQPEAPLSM
jgi:hypothetical protein